MSFLKMKKETWNSVISTYGWNPFQKINYDLCQNDRYFTCLTSLLIRLHWNNSIEVPKEINQEQQTLTEKGEELL